MVQALGTNPLSDRLEKRLTTYGTMAVAAIACAGNADAAPIITYLGPDITANNSHVWFNPVTGQVAHSNFSGAKFYLRNTNWSQLGYSGGTIYRLALAGWQTASAAVQLAGGWTASRLRSSTNIPGGYRFNYRGMLAYYRFSSFLTNTYRSYHTSAWNSAGNWLGGGRGFLGLRFDHLGNLHYGWADITVDPNTFAITLHRLAWNDTALAQIHTGEGAPIPEPASVVLLAMGAAGLAAYRRRKAVKS